MRRLLQCLAHFTLSCIGEHGNAIVCRPTCVCVCVRACVCVCINSISFLTSAKPRLQFRHTIGYTIVLHDHVIVRVVNTPMFRSIDEFVARELACSVLALLKNLMDLAFFMSLGMVAPHMIRVIISVASTAGLPPNETTFAEVAQQHGYSTALIGQHFTSVLFGTFEK